MEMASPDRMDDLLAKLRRSMAELSLQGDDFARQMCQMYAIFEEVVGPQVEPVPTQPVLRENPIRLAPRDARARQTPLQQAILPLPSLREAPVRQDSPTRTARRTATLYGSPGVRRRRIPQGKVKTKPSSMMEQYLPPPARPHHQRSHSESSAGSNPLLDTISVLTYDPNEDSDDYYDFAFARPRVPSSTASAPPIGGGGQDEKRVTSSDLDRDSVGYAGSNSVDSGYKSLCPTPEIPDAGYEPRGASAPEPVSEQEKNKIVMGTRVMEFHKPKTPGPRPESSYYTVDLDHLMYLRQSLLSAIQKCEAIKTEDYPTPDASRPFPAESSPGPTTPSRRVTCSGRTRRRSEPKSPPTSSSSDSSPSSQKTVRFETDIRVTGSPRSSPRPSRKQSKSILKDPLCASIRSQLSTAEVSPCSFEEEIDALLYGKAEYYDLESVREFPSSYVTMIEEKYRGGKASLARVKRLKDPVKATTSWSSCRPDPPASKLKSAGGEDQEVLRSCPPSQEIATLPSCSSSGMRNKTEKEPSGAGSKSKNRFTEVARCMLEILEDIHLKRQGKKQASVGDTTHQQSTLPRSWKSKKERKSLSSTSPSSGAPSSTPVSDYHVYEEIMYDLVGGGGAGGHPSECPPPLPARPTGLFKDQAGSPSGQIPAPLRAFRSHTYSGNRPKQRSNLYSLFSDQVERRHISRSLEQEWTQGSATAYQKVSQPASASSSSQADDDYGFRSVFPAL